MLDLAEHDADSAGDRDRSFGTKVAIDAGPTSSAGLATFAVQDGEGEDQLHDVPTWTAVAGAPRSFTSRTARANPPAGSRQQPVAKRRKNVALEDDRRMARVLSAIRAS
jgi:hypothetical protein